VEVDYHTTETEPTPNSKARYRGVSYVKPIAAAKEAVPVIDLADRLCGPGRLRRVGDRWVGRCPLPDHEDKTPSFAVYAETNSWWCFGCLRGGDAVNLYRLAHDYSEREAHTAAGFLVLEFGHTPPQRPPSWFRKNERQQAIRNAVLEAKVEVLSRRLWRYIFEPVIAEIEDPDERVEAAHKLWNTVEFRARQIIQQREASKR
jgi:DNA primase